MINKIKSKFRDFIGKLTYPKGAVKIYGDVYVECYPMLGDFSWTLKHKYKYREFEQDSKGFWKATNSYLYTDTDYSKC